MTPRRLLDCRLHGRRLLALCLVAAWTVAGGCASDSAYSAGGVAVVIEGSSVASSDLFARVSRELSAFGAGRHRAAHAADAAYGLEQELRDRGFAHATVAFHLLPNEEAPESLVLRVDEGPLVRLGDVSFPGHRTMRSSELEAFLRRRSLPILGRAPLYRQADVDAAVADIERVYLLAGHYKVQVGPPRVTFGDERARADVTIPIKEGRLFTVSGVQLEAALGDEARKALQARLPHPGDAFHVRVAAEAAARVRGWLREQGHRTAVVTARHEIDTESATARVIVDAQPGPVHVVRSFAITGTSRTDADFARERVALLSGDILHQSDLDAAIDALYTTGAFERVRVSPPPESEGDALVQSDLEFLVDEAEARSVEIGGGWGSYELLRGWIAYRDRNFTGRARSLDIEANASLKSAGIGLRVGDRYVLGENHTLSSGLRFASRAEPSFDSRALDFDVQVRHDVDPAHHVTYGYRMRIEEARNRDSVVRGAEDDRSRAAGLFGSVGHDTRDDRLFPTRGVLAAAGVFWSTDALGGDLHFLEWNAAWSRYVPLGNETVLAIGTRFTTRRILDASRTLPIQERLFLGGESSVRSFLEGELGPTDGDGDPQGGLTSGFASVEVRRRLWRDLDGALFADVGTISADSMTLNNAAGGALGIGLRYRLPVGPVRLDFGYNPLHRFGSDRRWAVHLSFGFSF